MNQPYHPPRVRVALVREREAPEFPAKILRSSADVISAFTFLRERDREEFWVAALDGKNRIIGTHCVSIGTLTALARPPARSPEVSHPCVGRRLHARPQPSERGSDPECGRPGHHGAARRRHEPVGRPRTRSHCHRRRSGVQLLRRGPASGPEPVPMLTVSRVQEAYRRLGFAPATDTYLDEGRKRCCPAAAVCLAEGRLRPRELTPPVAWRNVIAALDEPSPYVVAFIDSVNRWNAHHWTSGGVPVSTRLARSDDPALRQMRRGWDDGERVALALLGPPSNSTRRVGAAG